MGLFGNKKTEENMSNNSSEEEQEQEQESEQNTCDVCEIKLANDKDYCKQCNQILKIQDNIDDDEITEEIQILIDGIENEEITCKNYIIIRDKILDKDGIKDCLKNDLDLLKEKYLK